MATINATVSIGSDIMSYATNISKTMTMKKAGTTTGLNLTTGLSSKRYTATTQVVLQTYNDVAVTSGGANKVYIRNYMVETGCLCLGRQLLRITISTYNLAQQRL